MPLNNLLKQNSLLPYWISNNLELMCWVYFKSTQHMLNFFRRMVQLLRHQPQSLAMHED